VPDADGCRRVGDEAEREERKRRMARVKEKMKRKE